MSRDEYDLSLEELATVAEQEDRELYAVGADPVPAASMDIHQMAHEMIQELAEADDDLAQAYLAEHDVGYR